MSNLFTLRTRGLEATGTNFQSEKVQLCLFYTKQPEHASFLRTEGGRIRTSLFSSRERSRRFKNSTVLTATLGNYPSEGHGIYLTLRKPFLWVPVDWLAWLRAFPFWKPLSAFRITLSFRLTQDLNLATTLPTFPSWHFGTPLDLTFPIPPGFGLNPDLRPPFRPLLRWGRRSTTGFDHRKRLCLKDSLVVMVW